MFCSNNLVKLWLLDGNVGTTSCRINGWLQAELGKHPENNVLLKNYNPKEYEKELQQILENVEKLLYPLIKGG